MGRPRKVLIEEKEEEKIVKQKFLVCSFCGNKQYELNSRDPTSAWCQKCGRCFEVHWKEE